MMMESIFDIHRFGNFLKRNFILSSRTYLFLLAIIVGAYVVGIIFYALFEASYAPLLLFLMGIFAVFSPNFLEKNMTKYNAVFDFTFPVSTLERLLYLFVKHVLVIPLLFIVLILILNTVAGVLPFSSAKYFCEEMSLDWLSYPLWVGFITMQSIFLVGYLTFKNYSFVKTWLTIIVVYIVIGMSFGMLIVAILPEADANVFEFIDFITAKSSLLKETPFGEGLDKVLTALLMWIVPVGMWVTSYFKLREKEI